MSTSAEKIAIIGLGYVGLPLALALAKKFPGTIGFDISDKRISDLKQGIDWANEHGAEEIKSAPIVYSSSIADLEPVSFFIVTVPTPITEDKKPDLHPVLSACKTVAAAIKVRKSGTTPAIVFESTVYPGLTEEICGPEIARLSGLKQGVDFKLGYSPERINPGDPVHKLESIIKVVAGEDAPTLARLRHVYGSVITAGLHEATSIAVAEAAKVLENTQRDINVALMNELALICDRLNIRTADVLAAARTKWNFLPFSPGLVGGHCIGVDPFYLTTRAEELGYNPHVILSGRRINDGMGGFIADKAVSFLKGMNIQPAKARVGILGLTFKENVRDLRNSRVPDIVEGLKAAGINALIHDPMVDPAMAQHEYGISLASKQDMQELDVLIWAVPHTVFAKDKTGYLALLKKGGVFMDVKSVLTPADITAPSRYWSL